MHNINDAAATLAVPAEQTSATMITLITIFCAWCGTYLGCKDGKGVSGQSHSICEPCIEAQMGGRLIG